MLIKRAGQTLRGVIFCGVTGFSLQACNDSPIVGSYSDKLGNKSDTSESRAQNSSDDDAGAAASAAETPERDSQQAYRDSCDPAGSESVGENATGRIDVRVCTSKDSLADNLKGPSEIKGQIAGKESQTVIASRDPSSPTQTAQISIPLLQSAALLDNNKGSIGALVVERKSPDQYSVFLGGAVSNKVSLADKKILVKISGPSIVQAVRFKLLAPAQAFPKTISIDRKKALEYFGNLVEALDKAAGVKKVCIDGDGCDNEDEDEDGSGRFSGGRGGRDEG